MEEARIIEKFTLPDCGNGSNHYTEAPQLVANLPVAIERGHPSGSFDPKLPLTSGGLECWDSIPITW